MTDIRELLTAIREWERAVAAFEAIDEPGFDRNYAWVEMSKASKKVTGNDHTTRALKHFVALADHVDALEAKITAALAIEELSADERIFKDSWRYHQGHNAARDEFRAVLTSEPTAASASEGEA